MKGLVKHHMTQPQGIRELSPFSALGRCDPVQLQLSLAVGPRACRSSSRVLLVPYSRIGVVTPMLQACGGGLMRPQK